MGSRANERKLRFTPFQLVAQYLEIGFPGWLDEFQLLFCTVNPEAIRRLHGNAALAVERQIYRFGDAIQLNLNATRIADDQRAIAEGVRTDGSDDERFDRGMDDRSARGE